jgi:NDP-sugar pyrophosphorylase family protein
MTSVQTPPLDAAQSSELALVVLAAGIGSRYGGLKQLEPVGPSGEALLEYSIFDALRAGYDKVVLVIRPETESAFRELLGPRLIDRVGVSYVFQDTSDLPSDRPLPHNRSKPWGTGHAVLTAESAVAGPFTVINADDFYGLDAFRTLADFVRGNPPGEIPTFALAGFDVGPTLSDAGPVSRGLCRANPSGWLEKIFEVPKLTKTGAGARYIDEGGVERTIASDDLVSMNMWGFTPEIFPELRRRFGLFLDEKGSATDKQWEFLIPDVVQGMVADGKARVKVLRHQGKWCGITFPEDRSRAQAFIAQLADRGEYPPLLWDQPGRL